VAVSVRCWCRVDLAGGTLDIWPLGLLHEDARTVNLAIEVPVVVRVSRLDAGFSVEQSGERVRASTAQKLAAHTATDLIGEVLHEIDSGPVAVEIDSASPRGGGLGASSALVVALIAAVETLEGRQLSSAREASAMARDLEARLMGKPTGRQDHFPAHYGGALEILHSAGGERVRQLEIDLEGLGRSLIVANTGRSHFSAGNNWEVVRRRLDGVQESIELFDGICSAARDLLQALEAGDLPEVGRQMSREWSFRRQLAAGVSTPEIERLLTSALEAGAWGGKVTGAGGGGCLAILASAEQRSAVCAALEAGGAQVLEVGPAEGGLLIEEL